MQVLTQVWKLLNGTQRRQLVGLQLLSVAMAFSTVGGIAAVVPFFTVLSDPTAIERNAALHLLYRRMHFDSEVSFVIALGVAFAVIVLLANAVSLFGTLAINRFALRVGDTFYVRLFDEYLRRDYGFHSRSSSAALASRLLHETGRVASGILQQGLILVANLLTIAFVMISIVLLNPLVAVGALTGLGASYAAIYAITRERLLRNGRNETRCYAERTRVVNESLGAIKEVIVLHAREYFVRRFAGQCRTISRIELSTLAISLSPRSILECGTVFCLVSVALYLRGRGGGVGTWVAQLSFIGLAAYRLLPALQQSFTAIVRIRANHSAFDSIADDLQPARSGEINTRTDITQRTWRGGLCREMLLRDVSFRYAPDRPEVICNVSLSLPAGAAIGFVGANGSGKTTLVDLLAGLLLPHSGRMEVDGIAIDPTNRSAWQSTIAYVPQHVFLLDATVAENVALGTPATQIDRKRVAAAISLARLTECVAALPSGYDEVLGERGCRLSGGQRQRLGIARALYRDASLLIFDEATSALDAVAEKEIADMLETLRPRRTVLMIAHQLSALRHCDVIHEIRNGMIVRSGTYREFQPAMRTRALNAAERED
jgi:ABC-type multidrug transport system fused ATPase/permease subunit